MPHTLKFRSLKVTPVAVPLANPVRTASGNITHSPIVLIDLLTEEGVEGRAYVFTYTPVVLKAVATVLESLASLLKDATIAPLETERILTSRFRLLGTAGVLGMALAGLDMAMWDALAKAAGMPLWQLLGGAERPAMAYFSQGMDGKERGMQLAEEAVRRGFKAMKIKIGYPKLEEDVEVVKAVKSVLGDSVGLMVDYNQSLSVSEAIRRGRALDEFALNWIEEPVAQDDYVGHARVANSIKTPVQRGENWFGTAEMQKSISVGGTDLVMIDVMKIGGVSGWLRAAALAQAHQLPLSSHIFQEFSAHLLCVTPTAHWLEYLDIVDPILEQPLQVKDGRCVLPTAAGAGLAWKSHAVDKLRIQ